MRRESGQEGAAFGDRPGMKSGKSGTSGPYFKGIGVKQDTDTAAEWYLKALQHCTAHILFL